MPTTTLTPTERRMKKLGALIASRTPVIGITTHEENRVTRKLMKIGQEAKQPKAVILWTSTMGFHKIDPNPDAETPFVFCDPPDERVTDVGAALMMLPERTDNGGHALYVFKDIHTYAAKAPIARAIRDLALLLVPTRKTLILMSHDFGELSADLEKSVEIIDFPLPGIDELRAAVLDARAEAIEYNLVKVSLNDEEADEVADALKGLTQQQAEGVLRQAMVQNRELSLSALDVIVEEKKQIVQQSRLEIVEPAKDRSHIGGLDLLDQYITVREHALTPEAAEFGVDPPRGVFFLGIPGAGKSLMAKAVGRGKRLLLRMDIGSLMGSLLGESEGHLRDALRVVEAVGGVLWIDEIEKGLAGDGGESNGGTAMRMMQLMLTWMQEQRGVYVVATANSLNGIRPEMLRRFDDVFWVDVPTFSARKQIFAIHLAKRKRAPGDFDLDALAAATHNYTGAEIEKVVREGLLTAWADGKRPMTTDDLANAARLIKPVVETMGNEITYLRNEVAPRCRLAASPEPEPQFKPKKAGVTFDKPKGGIEL